MHILSRKSKSIDISTSREGGEREMCVLFEFRHFFIYVFQSFVYIFAKNSERRDVLCLSDCITL